ncbi:hypothetical protein CLAVI_000555 [Candidatus Clavichlamydia salmonicola]|uniref:ComEC/Rec2 family competence protein n=1 Tax=Candidatus Clavichlamydia salmonicola TaxID=469812 RepID=UPI0018917AC5|nr:ComEC/Rec2 family competence protein [Candidatus Clavichlamydia salmonicola]MBF5050933.1 hypothetical protein [Candidatus Clavichlamydia salmonicola]
MKNLISGFLRKHLTYSLNRSLFSLKKTFYEWKFSILSIFYNFFTSHPGFLLGSAWLLGSLFAHKYILTLFPITLLFLLIPKDLFIKSFLCFLIPLSFVSNQESKNTIPCPTEGIGTFRITNIRTLGKRGYIYNGRFITFCNTNNHMYYNKNASFHSFHIYSTNNDYNIKCKLKIKNKTIFIFNHSIIQRIQTHFCLQSINLKLHNQLEKFIKKRIIKKNACSFFTALFSATIDDICLNIELQNLGLSHILVVSGLHFSLVLTFLRHLLKGFIAPKKLAIILLFPCSFLLWFFGTNPSSTRAWASQFFLIGGIILERPITSLSRLGYAAIITLMINPSFCLYTGWQLSFGATAGILFFYPFISTIFHFLLHPELVPFPKLTPYIKPLLIYCAETLSLSCAVHFMILPLLFHQFGSLPLATFFYNLVLPPFFLLTVFLFLIATLMNSTYLFSLTSYVTDKILLMVEFPPLLFKKIYIKMTPLTLCLSLTLILLLGIILQTQKKPFNKGFLKDIK